MNKKGFSLIELLIVIGVSGILLASLASIFYTQSKTYSVHSNIGEVQYAAKSVLDYIAKEIRMAGAGMLDQNYEFKNGNTFAHLSSINSDTGPDAIRIRGNFQGVYGIISSTVGGSDVGDEAIKVAYRERAVFSVGNYITITDNKNSEIRYITGVSSDKKTISFANGDGLTYAYKNGTTFNGIQEIRYYVDSSGTLRRNNFEYNGNQPVLENVEDLQFQYGLDLNGDGVLEWVNSVNDGTYNARDVKAVKIWLIVRGDTPDSNFVDNNSYFLGISSTGMKYIARRYTPPTNLQKYRRLLFTTTVELRNKSLGSQQ